MTIPIEDATQRQRMTAVEFFTPGAHRVLRVLGNLSALALAIVVGAYIYRAGYERGMADAQPTVAVPTLYRWLANDSSRAEERRVATEPVTDYGDRVASWEAAD